MVHAFVLSVCVCMSVQDDNAKKKRIFLGATAAKHTVMDAKLS